MLSPSSTLTIAPKRQATSEVVHEEHLSVVLFSFFLSEIRPRVILVHLSPEAISGVAQR